MTLPGTPPRTATYAYDLAGRLTTLTDRQSRATTFSYNADSQRTGIVRPNGVTTTSTYDAAGQPAQVEHATAGGMLQRFAYGRDLAGNGTSVTATPGGTEVYALDELNRLTQATYRNGDTVAYAYDPNGNRSQRMVNGAVITTYSYNNADELTQVSGAETLNLSYDANGNLTTAGADTYAWDWANRLSSATVGGTTATYAYAGDDARATKTSGGVTTPYLWDRLAGLATLVDDGTQRFLHAGGGVLADIDGANDAAYPPSRRTRQLARPHGRHRGVGRHRRLRRVRRDPGANGHRRHVRLRGRAARR